MLFVKEELAVFKSSFSIPPIRSIEECDSFISQEVGAY